MLCPHRVRAIAELAVKLCTVDASESSIPPPAKLLISAASPLKCYTNAPMGLVLRDLEWFQKNNQMHMHPSPLTCVGKRAYFAPMDQGRKTGSPLSAIRGEIGTAYFDFLLLLSRGRPPCPGYHVGFENCHLDPDTRSR